jgi:asparagine synthase (glutamine-hydrolysing)
VTDHLGIGLNAIRIDPLKPPWSIKRALFQVEDPYLTLPLPMLTAYAAIRAAGIRVTLDGHGADELFCGYGHHGAALLDAGAGERSEIVSIGKSLRSGVLEPTGPVAALLAGAKELLRYRVIARLPASRKLRFAHATLPQDHPDYTHPAYAAMDNLSKALYRAFHITALPTLLRNYDRYSMASGVEIRMPFMDWRLVCYTFSLPWKSKLGGGYTKRIARDAMRGIAPDTVIRRRDKIGWNAPLHEWLRGPLRAQVETLLREDASLPAAKGKVTRAWNSFLSNPAPTYSDGERAWQLLLPWIWQLSLNPE